MSIFGQSDHLPLIEKRTLESGAVLGIWKIAEPPEYFEGLLELTQAEEAEKAQIKGRRQLEWLASRWLLHVVSERRQRGEVLKDRYGKPRLAGSRWEISISHTRDYAAVLIGPTRLGIDIQTPVAKIQRIAHKFLSTDEQSNVAIHRSQEFLHVYWGAKESLYKAYGRRSLDFRQNIRIDPFNLEQGATTGSVVRDVHLAFDIRFEISQAYVLVYATEVTL